MKSWIHEIAESYVATHKPVRRDLKENYVHLNEEQRFGLLSENVLVYLDEQLQNAYGFGVGDLTEEELGKVLQNLFEYKGAIRVAAKRGIEAGESRERRIQTAGELTRKLRGTLALGTTTGSINPKSAIPERIRTARSTIRGLQSQIPPSAEGSPTAKGTQDAIDAFSAELKGIRGPSLLSPSRDGTPQWKTDGPVSIRAYNAKDGTPRWKTTISTPTGDPTPSSETPAVQQSPETPKSPETPTQPRTRQIRLSGNRHEVPEGHIVVVMDDGVAMTGLPHFVMAAKGQGKIKKIHNPWKVPL